MLWRKLTSIELIRFQKSRFYYETVVVHAGLVWRSELLVQVMRPLSMWIWMRTNRLIRGEGVALVGLLSSKIGKFLFIQKFRN